VAAIEEKYGLSKRHACGIVGQRRGTQRYVPTVLADEDELTQAIIALASDYGRYGYRRITALLQAAGWQVGKDRVQRIWRREGLKVPSRHRPRRRRYRDPNDREGHLPFWRSARRSKLLRAARAVHVQGGRAGLCLCGSASVAPRRLCWRADRARWEDSANPGEETGRKRRTGYRATRPPQPLLADLRPS
jgi:hypothetical protein